MAYWRYAILWAWSKTFVLLTGGIETATIVVAIFCCSTLLAHNFRGKDELVEWLWDGFLGSTSLVIIGLTVFVVELFICAPIRPYTELQTANAALARSKHNSVEEHVDIDYTTTCKPLDQTMQFIFCVTNTGNVPVMIKNIDFEIADKESDSRTTRSPLSSWVIELRASRNGTGLIQPSEMITYTTDPIPFAKIDTITRDSNGFGTGVVNLITANGSVINRPVDMIIADFWVYFSVYNNSLVINNTLLPTPIDPSALEKEYAISLTKQDMANMRDAMKKMLYDGAIPRIATLPKANLPITGTVPSSTSDKSDPSP